MDKSAFWPATLAMIDAIVKILLVAGVAGLLVRRKILTQDHIKGLSEATVKVFLPALSFSVILKQFRPYQATDWWILPVLGFVFPIVFMGITALFYIPRIKQHMNKFPIASLQNVGYLVLPIGQILYPSRFDQFAVYVFLLILGFNIALWTVGKLLVSYQAGKTELKLAEMITPPFVANILGILMVLSKTSRFVPEIILEPIDILGQAAVPLGMFILGATLGSVNFRQLPAWVDIVKLSFVKYVLMPATAMVLLILSGVSKSNPLLADVLMIEASAAPAANLIVIVKKYGGDQQLVGSLMLIMYLEAIVMMPLWLGIWQMF